MRLWWLKSVVTRNKAYMYAYLIFFWPIQFEIHTILLLQSGEARSARMVQKGKPFHQEVIMSYPQANTVRSTCVVQKLNRVLLPHHGCFLLLYQINVALLINIDFSLLQIRSKDQLWNFDGKACHWPAGLFSMELKPAGQRNEWTYQISYYFAFRVSAWWES